MQFLFLAFLGLFICSRGARLHRIEDIEFVYEVPSQPLGVLVLAHGCGHSATDWFPKSIECESCLGLPIEQRIVNHSLSQGLFTLAISSKDRNSKCWTSADRSRVVKILTYVHDEILNFTRTGKKTPLFLMGISSGGSFVGSLAYTNLPLGFKLFGVCVEISTFELPRHPVADPPAVIYVTMPRDTYTTARVSKAMVHISKFSSYHAVFSASPKPLSPDFFSQFGTLNLTQSTRFVSALKNHGFLTTEMYLQSDPRSSEWRQVNSNCSYMLSNLFSQVALEALPIQVLINDTLQPDVSGISELLNYAYGYHEITHEHVYEVTYSIVETKKR